MESFFFSPCILTVMSSEKKRLPFALKAFGIHLTASCAVALAVAWLVFSVWVPAPYQGLVQAPQLFIVLLLVDVVCGPLLTAVLANPAKPRKELRLDFALVVLIQLGALAYGLHTIAHARPVALVFEVDRFAVVSASQIDTQELTQATAELQKLPWNGPQLLGTRAAHNPDEKLQSIELSLQGIEPSARPGWWQSYELSRPQVLARMQPLQALHQRAPAAQRALVDAELHQIQRSITQTFYLPLVSSHQLDSWIVLLDAQANIVGHVAVDGFQ